MNERSDEQIDAQQQTNVDREIRRNIRERDNDDKSKYLKGRDEMTMSKDGAM